MNEQQHLADEIASVQRAGRTLDRTLGAISVGAMLFAAVGVTLLANQHGVHLWAAWALDPLAAGALFAVLQAEAILGRHGIRPGGWVATLRLFAGVATLTMNVWAPVAGRDPAGIVVHSVPPLLMIVLGLAAPRVRRAFATVVTKLQAELDQLRAAESARRRADIERETKAREVAAETFRAQRERDRAERDRPTETETETETETTAKTAEEIIREAWEADRAAGTKIVAAKYDRLAGTNNYARGLIRRWTTEVDGEPAEAVA
jgi:hypothetical protein